MKTNMKNMLIAFILFFTLNNLNAQNNKPKIKVYLLGTFHFVQTGDAYC